MGDLEYRLVWRRTGGLYTPEPKTHYALYQSLPPVLRKLHRLLGHHTACLTAKEHGPDRGSAEARWRMMLERYGDIAWWRVDCREVGEWDTLPCSEQDLGVTREC